MREDSVTLDTYPWDARVRALYDYWLARCRDGCPPRRSDIDPIDLPHLLRWLWLVDVTRDAPGWPLRFRTKYREYGGSWLYPMGDDMISLGYVIGLDYADASPIRGVRTGGGEEALDVVVELNGQQ